MKKLKICTGYAAALVILAPVFAFGGIAIASSWLSGRIENWVWPMKLIDTAERIDVWSRQ